MKIIKSNGSETTFSKSNIINAISKANMKVRLEDRFTHDEIKKIAKDVEDRCKSEIRVMTSHDIQNIVEHAIMEAGKYDVAISYITYRYQKQLDQRKNTTDERILSLLDDTNEVLKQENSNKNPTVINVQRDYMAGEVSKDLCERYLIPSDIWKAHEEGIIHFHDSDYFANREYNCNLWNAKDMLENGTVLCGVKIDRPHRFSVACTIASQIAQQISSSQYGGQSLYASHLSPFVEESRNFWRREFPKMGIEPTEENVEKATIRDVEDGIQTLMYQLNSLHGTNGQAPFITIFMYLDDVEEGKERDDLALVCKKIFEQRLLGLKDKNGIYVSPAFPKLIYVLDEDNIHDDSPYFWLTELAAKCTANRMVPDYISAKVMKELKDGNVYSSMGCVDGKEIITYRDAQGNVKVDSFESFWDTYKTDVKQSGNSEYIQLSDVDIYDSYSKDFVKCHGIIRNPDKGDWLRLTIGHGRTLLCTSDHPLPVKGKGRVFAKDLQPGDVLEGITDFYKGTEDILHPDVAWLLGVVLCDANLQTYNITSSFSMNGEDDIIEKYVRVFKEHFNINCSIKEQHRGVKGEYKDVKLDGSLDERKAVIAKLLKEIPIVNKLQRKIPNFIFNANKEIRSAFLAGIIDADGYIHNMAHHNQTEIGSTNKVFALQQLALVNSLGFNGKVRVNMYKGNKSPNKIRYQVSFKTQDTLFNDIACSKKKANFVSRKDVSDYAEFKVIKITPVEHKDFSYDVTTESDHFDVSGINSHNCRSFLTVAYVDRNDPWKITTKKRGVPKFVGRFNQGVVTLNLPDVALSSGKDIEKFWYILDERLELCHRALRLRHERLRGVKSDVAPILWQNGAIARLKPGETIDKLLYNGYSTISLGYVGLYETVKYLTGKNHWETEDEGGAFEFAMQIMQRLNDKCKQWKEVENIDYSVYGSPEESTTYKFAKALQTRFGKIKGITDKNFVTNSYHIPVWIDIDAFEKLSREAQLQRLSPGGAISYIEAPNMTNNIPAIVTLLRHMYDTIMYAEINLKLDTCEVCGYQGAFEIKEIDGKLQFVCPECGETEFAHTPTKLRPCRRVCGYISTNQMNQGRMADIEGRVEHI